MLHQYMMSHEARLEPCFGTVLPRHKHITVTDTDKRSHYVYVRALTADLVSTHCSCEFYTSHELWCSHIFCVLNAYQIRSAEQIEPSERWTRRYQWENFMQDDLQIMP